MAKMNLGRVVGRSAYEEAVRVGYEGDEAEWLKSLEGDSAYQLAVSQGYRGDLESWLESQKGKSAYKGALEAGFSGTEEEFNKSTYVDITEGLKRTIDWNIYHREQ